jgi:hypothetical protein
MCSSSPTRGSVGGLPRGEYLAHIVLSVLVGMVLVEVPGTIAIAKRLVPLGMLGVGAYIHAGTNVIAARSRISWLGYGCCTSRRR